MGGGGGGLGGNPELASSPRCLERVARDRGPGGDSEKIAARLLPLPVTVAFTAAGANAPRSLESFLDLEVRPGPDRAPAGPLRG